MRIQTSPHRPDARQSTNPNDIRGSAYRPNYRNSSINRPDASQRPDFRMQTSPQRPEIRNISPNRAPPIKEDYQGGQEQDDDEVIVILSNPTIIKLRKVLLLISFQLLVAVVACYLTLQYDKQVKALPELIFWIALATLTICILFGLFQRYSHTHTTYKRPQLFKYPTNWLVYFTFLVSFAVTVSCVAVLRGIDYFLLAIIGMFLQTLGQFIYVNASKLELTYQGASVFIFAALLLQIQGFLVASTISFNHIIIGTIFSVIWGFYLVFDTYTFEENYLWLNEGGVDDYVASAVSVYIDIPMMGLSAASMMRATLFKSR